MVFWSGVTLEAQNRPATWAIEQCIKHLLDQAGSWARRALNSIYFITSLSTPPLPLLVTSPYPSQYIAALPEKTKLAGWFARQAQVLVGASLLWFSLLSSWNSKTGMQLERVGSVYTESICGDDVKPAIKNLLEQASTFDIRKSEICPECICPKGRGRQTNWASTKTSIDSPMSYDNAYATLAPLQFLLTRSICWFP